jgi:hypothetical protein
MCIVQPINTSTPMKNERSLVVQRSRLSTDGHPPSTNPKRTLLWTPQLVVRGVTPIYLHYLGGKIKPY